MVIEGEYFQSGSSLGVPASLVFQGQSLSLEMGHSSRLLDLDALEISPRLANVPRHLAFPDGSLFSSLQNNQLDEALRSSGRAPKNSWINYFETGWHWTLLALIVVPVFLVMLFTIGMPLVAGTIAPWIPEAVKEELDAGAVELLDELVFKPSNLAENKTKALEESFLRVSRFLPNQHGQLLFRDGSALGANAFALPGGTIIFTDQLVKLAENEGELVAIYAHEMGHIIHDHSMRNLLQSTGVTFVIGWMLGDFTFITDVVLVGVPVLMQKMSYSRGFEREADQFAMLVLDASGYSRRCFGDIIERLSKQRGNELSSKTSYISSHPAPGQRVALSSGAPDCADRPPGVGTHNKPGAIAEPSDRRQLAGNPEITPPFKPTTSGDIEVDLSEGEYHSVSKVAPTYPFPALVRKIEGYCVVEYTITIEGKVVDPVVLEDQCTSPYFAEPSLAAARGFRYKPRVENGKAMAVPGVQNRFTYKIANPGEKSIKPPFREPVE